MTMTEAFKILLVGAVSVIALGGPASAAEPEACGTVRFSDVGWTDITATTAVSGYRNIYIMRVMYITTIGTEEVCRSKSLRDEDMIDCVVIPRVWTLKSSTLGNIISIPQGCALINDTVG